jgi:hypothetical protein
MGGKQSRLDYFWFNLILKLLLSNLKLELLTGQIIHKSVYVYDLTIKKGEKVFGNLTIVYRTFYLCLIDVIVLGIMYGL